MRLQKYIARTGYCSRRNAEKYILENKVRVNGTIVNEPWYMVKSGDEVSIGGKRISPEEKKVYIMVNKPAGFVSTAKDQFGRRDVTMLAKDVKERLYPVGRLDYDTTGLILLTNDGDFAYRITHPKHEIYKTYEAWIQGILTPEEARRFERGLVIDGVRTAPAKIKVLERQRNKSKVEIRIYEGRNHQIKKMCEEVGHRVIKLYRTQLGNLKLGDLKPGKYRHLDDEDMELIFSR